MVQPAYTNSVEVLKKNGKSFYFSGYFLGAKNLAPIASLYSLCRYIDDCADEMAPEAAMPRIQAIKAEIQRAALSHRQISQSNMDTNQALSQPIRDLISRGVDPVNLLELVEGAEFDLRGHLVTNQKELLRYCYLVAGVVGLMMCPLLGVKSAEAKGHAVDLGVGMQLTNICRDILEDFQRGRVYLPEVGKHSQEIQKRLASVELKTLVEGYLDLADRFYQSAYQGLPYLPLRSRIVILWAGEVYRHIGRELRKRGCDPLQGRVYVPLWKKFWVAFKSLRFLFLFRFYFGPRRTESSQFIGLREEEL